ncbi:MAG: thiamine pyrophosphate-dependent enzyme, partial [Chloroflexi bacterium]|nr:thiamine pyrophosphate-dependent enzyme [Chloroflexota bacterium]
MRKLLSGNEAMALGSYHAGVSLAAAYPGTPSTEILENLAKMDGIYVEWSTNEKVAVEVAMGASYGGVRALACMKHVGLNVAADPFFAASVTGIRGGMVVVCCDDPGMHSSQNEQDSRQYARFAKVPMLEPGDSQDAYSIMGAAFDISEQYDTPILVRSTTRVSHCKSVAEIDGQPRISRRTPSFLRDPHKLVMVPSNARPRHPLMEHRLLKLIPVMETFPLNELVAGGSELGIISSGAAYLYAREVFANASFLKLVTTYPLPRDLICRFANTVKRVAVVEELDPFLEEQLKLMGINVIGKELVPLEGELNPEILRRKAFDLGLLPAVDRPFYTTGVQRQLPPRPPLLCPGCPHTALSYALKTMRFSVPAQASSDQVNPGNKKRRRAIATSDIGCYTLAVYPPLEALDTCACMGASIGQAHGLEKAGVTEKTVSVIGDSTFMHSGITSLVDIVYNGGHGTVIILDNNTTAMTGHQGHPGTGVSARGQMGRRVVLEDLARGIGVKDVNVVDAFNLQLIQDTIRRCVDTNEPSVLIVRGP